MDRLEDHTIVPARRAHVRAALAEMEVFRDIPANLLDQLVAEFRFAEVEPGTVVVAQGTAGNQLFVVDEGELDVTVHLGDRDRVIGRLGRGELFGEAAVLRETPRTATVTARTHVRLWTLTAESLSAWIERVPGLRERVTDILRRRELANALMSLQ